MEILQSFLWKQRVFILSFEVHCKLEKIKSIYDLFNCEGMLVIAEGNHVTV